MTRTKGRKMTSHAKITIDVYCKPYLRAEAQRKLDDGTFERMVVDYINEFGEDANNAYALRYHVDGTMVTIGKARDTAKK